MSSAGSRVAGWIVLTVWMSASVSCGADSVDLPAALELGGERLPLAVGDASRRPDAAETVVPSGTEDPLVLRVRAASSADSASGPVDDGEVRGVAFVLSGNTAGAGAHLLVNDQIQMTLSAAALVSGRAAGDGRAMYRFSELTPGLPSEFFDGGEIEFFNEGPAPYEIHEITFTTESPPPSVVFSASAAGDLPRFDSRLPTEFREAGVIVDGVATLAARRTDAIEVGYFMDPEAFRSGGSRPRVTLTLVADDGTHRDFVAYLRPGENRLIVRPALWLRRLEAVSLSITEAPTGFSPRVVRRIPTSTDARTPIPSGLTELLMYPREWWRGEAFELFSWSLYPRILWVDSVTYAQQAAMFRRLAFFVEKRGFQGRLLTDEELRGRHGWNAHNYRPEGLAAFYNAVRETDFPINPQERELLRIVLENGILVEETDGSFLPGDGGILAVSQESYDELRRLLIVHEAMHGIFYQEPEFRDAVFAYWDAELNQRERAFWRDFLSWASYEPDDRYLMVNEFQGYLLQQQQAAVRWYFRSRYRERLENAYPDRRESISLFMRDHPSTFVDAGAAMNDALFRIVGMVGGDPFCLAAPPARE